MDVGLLARGRAGDDSRAASRNPAVRGPNGVVDDLALEGLIRSRKEVAAMRLSWKDGLATVLVAVALVFFAGWSAGATAAEWGAP